MAAMCSLIITTQPQFRLPHFTLAVFRIMAQLLARQKLNNAMNDSSFWQEVRKRRNLFFLWWIVWPPAGLILIGLYYLISGHEAPALITNSIFCVWAVLWLWTIWRFRQLRCPQCGAKAFTNPFFVMQDAECRHCGLKNDAKGTAPNSDTKTTA